MTSARRASSPITPTNLLSGNMLTAIENHLKTGATFNDAHELM